MLRLFSHGKDYYTGEYYVDFLIDGQEYRYELEHPSYEKAVNLATRGNAHGRALEIAKKNAKQWYKKAGRDWVLGESMVENRRAWILLEELKETVAVLLAEEGGKLNSCSLPLDKARDYGEKLFADKGKDFNEALPNFDENYTLLQKKCKDALNIPRIDMPVIEPQDMADFDKALKSGEIDIFEPYAKGHLYTPKQMSPGEGDQRIKLGTKDGNPHDDVIEGLWTKMPAKNLFPTQNEIWLEKVFDAMLKFGLPKEGSSVTDTTIIVSEEGYILDGHHRFGQVILADPELKMKVLEVPLDIDLLVTIGRSYGAAIGNKPKP